MLHPLLTARLSWRRPVPPPHPRPQERLIRGQREISEQVYNGTYPWFTYASMESIVGEGVVPLHVFHHLAALVS
jgi:hypothetical protein